MSILPRSSLLVRSCLLKHAPAALQVRCMRMDSEKIPHTHDRLWSYERYLSLGLLGAFPMAAMMPGPIMDHLVAVSLVVHVHWGVEAIVTDYVRPSIFGKTIPKIAVASVYVISSLALGGLFMFNYSDVGLTQATRMLASI